MKLLILVCSISYCACLISACSSDEERERELENLDATGTTRTGDIRSLQRLEIQGVGLAKDIDGNIATYNRPFQFPAGLIFDLRRVEEDELPLLMWELNGEGAHITIYEGDSEMKAVLDDGNGNAYLFATGYKSVADADYEDVEFVPTRWLTTSQDEDGYNNGFNWELCINPVNSVDRVGISDMPEDKRHFLSLSPAFTSQGQGSGYIEALALGNGATKILFAKDTATGDRIEVAYEWANIETLPTSNCILANIDNLEADEGESSDELIAFLSGRSQDVSSADAGLSSFSDGSLPNSAIIGEENAPNSLVMFFSLGCPSCLQDLQAHTESMKASVEAGTLRIELIEVSGLIPEHADPAVTNAARGATLLVSKVFACISDLKPEFALEHLDEFISTAETALALSQRDWKNWPYANVDELNFDAFDSGFPSPDPNDAAMTIATWYSGSMFPSFHEGECWVGEGADLWSDKVNAQKDRFLSAGLRTVPYYLLNGARIESLDPLMDIR